MQTFLVGRTDVHAGAFSDWFQAFEDLDSRCVVIGGFGWHFFCTPLFNLPPNLGGRKMVREYIIKKLRRDQLDK